MHQDQAFLMQLYVYSVSGFNNSHILKRTAKFGTVLAAGQRDWQLGEGIHQQKHPLHSVPLALLHQPFLHSWAQPLEGSSRI